MNQLEHGKYITMLETKLRKHVRQASCLLFHQAEIQVEAEKQEDTQKDYLVATVKLGDLFLGEHLSVQQIVESTKHDENYLEFRSYDIAERLQSRVIKEGIDALTTNTN